MGAEYRHPALAGHGGGGGYSTVGDLLRFAQALESGTLLSEATLAEATRPHQQQYGYGFDMQGQGSLRSYGHGGGAPGMNGELRVFLELGYVVVSLSNLDPRPPPSWWSSSPAACRTSSRALSPYLEPRRQRLFMRLRWSWRLICAPGAMTRPSIGRSQPST